MTTTNKESTLDEMRAQALKRAHDITIAFMDAEGNDTAASLAAAFHCAADGLREQADAATEARRKGWQSFTKDIRAVAGRLVGIAQDLAELAKLEELQPATIAEDVAHETARAEVGMADVRAVQLYATDGDGSDPSAADRIDALNNAQVHAYLAGEIDTLPDDVFSVAQTDDPASQRHQTYSDAARGFPPLTDAELANEGIAVPAPHLAFMDPAPISLPPREPFPGAGEHRRSFGDLMLPVDPAVVPDHWSWFQLTDAEDCGLQHRLSRLEHVPQQPQWANIGGTTFHNVTERFDRAAWQAGGADLLPEPHPELLKQRWEDAFAAEIDRVSRESGIEMGETGENFRASKGGKEGYTWWLIEGERMLALYIANRRKLDKAGREAGTLAVPLELISPSAPDPATGLAGYATLPVIEFPYDRPVSGPIGTLTVKGVIDRAYRCADGSIIVKDLKSGGTAPDSGQLGEYAWALAHLLVLPGRTDLPVIRGCFYDARKGLFTDPVGLLGQPRHPHEEYVYRYHAAQAQRATGIYLPHKSAWCAGCSVRHACPVGGPTP